MSTRNTSPLVSIYDGQTRRGFIIARGVEGFEVFTADERSLGIFPKERDAINALCAAADKESS
jgi:hypothetical protein